MNTNIFIYLGITAYFLSICSMVFFWHYAAKRSKYKILYAIYSMVLCLLLCMSMAFDFRMMSFDPKNFNSFIDYPTMLPTMWMIFLLARFCFGNSIISVMSKTLDREVKTEFKWWQYLFSLFGTALVFSFLLMVKDMAGGKEIKFCFIMFWVGLTPAAIYILYCLPFPFIQQEKNSTLDPWT